MAGQLSRTQDLINQIRQITIEIRDIKRRKQDNINSKETINTVNIHNHKLSDPLQECHEEHDEDVGYYVYNAQTVHPLLDNTNTLTHYAPTPLPPEGVPTSWPPWPPEPHPSSPNSGSPSKPTSKTPPWSNEPADPESPGNEGDNAGGVVGLLWTTTNGTPSGGNESVANPNIDDKKVGE